MERARSDASVVPFPPSGSLLRRIVENAALGMAITDIAGNMLLANRALRDLLGYGEEEPLPREARLLVLAEDSGKAAWEMARLAAGTAESFRSELRLRRTDGGDVWTLFTGSLLRNEASGEPQHLVLQVVGIDAQKRAEAELAASERRLHFALEAGQQGVWEHHIPTDAMRYSRMWRHLRGIPPDEEVDGSQEAWLARLHPQDLDRIRAIVSRQDSGQDGCDLLEYRERHRDGHYVWIRSRGRPVEWDAEGNPVRTLGTDTDITRLKEVELALAAEKERLRVMLQAIADGVIATGADGTIEFVNPSAEILTGMSLAEAIGQPFSGLIRLLDEGIGEIDPARVIADGDTFVGNDVRLILRNGSQREVRLTVSPLLGEDWTVDGAVVVLQDVTEERSLQRKLKHAASHDPLTGLLNRRAFEQELELAHALAERNGRNFAVACMDLDRFKAVNDASGHAAGDSVLQRVSELIVASLLPGDVAARVGGDEFSVLFRNGDLDAVRARMSALRDAISAARVPYGAAWHSVGASFGVSTIGGASSIERALEAADAECYRDKAERRGSSARG